MATFLMWMTIKGAANFKDCAAQGAVKDRIAVCPDLKETSYILDIVTPIMLS